MEVDVKVYELMSLLSRRIAGEEIGVKFLADDKEFRGFLSTVEDDEDPDGIRYTTLLSLENYEPMDTEDEDEGTD
jgi:hypothetical protein